MSNDEIGKALDVNILPYEKKASTAIAVAAQSTTEQDFDTARANLMELITDGKDVLDSLISIAQTSENARTFEVTANFIKTLAEVNRELIEVSLKKRAVTGETSTAKTVNNNLFVGSTAELQEFLQKNMKNV